MALLQSQPKTDIVSNVIVSASFNPAVVRPGQDAIYQVTFNALEESIEWPEHLQTSPNLDIHPGGHGQIMQFLGTSFVPHTSFNYTVRAGRVGDFTQPSFSLKVYDKMVSVPAATLRVVADLPASAPIAPRLLVTVPATSVFVGQPIRARVTLPPPAAGQVLMQVQLEGEGFLLDQASARQQVTPIERGRFRAMSYGYETTLIPLRAGKIRLLAQGFTVQARPSTPFAVPGSPNPPAYLQPVLVLDSEPLELRARSLPRQGELPGFTGAIGSFSMDPPSLSTNVAQVGDVVRLSVTVHGDANLARLAAPPPPRSPEWQILTPSTDLPPAQSSAGRPFGSQVGIAKSSVTFVYTLIPLTTAAKATPAIPFCYFNPLREEYVALPVSSLPISVTGGTVPVDLAALQRRNPAGTESDMEPAFRDLASSPGRTAASLEPSRSRVWLELAPAGAFLGLWGWDRRGRYLAAHPEILLRRRARRTLRRQWRDLRRAARAGDGARFAAAAVTALRAACAPHFPAEPRALVSADILHFLSKTGDAEHGKEVARRFFATTDAARFGLAAVETKDLLKLQPELEQLLAQLDGKLCA